MHYKNVYIKNNHKYLYGYIVLAICMVIIRAILAYSGNTLYPKYLSAYNNILVFSESVLLFLYFVNLKITNKRLCSIVPKLSPFVLGLYLLHEVQYMRKYICNDLFHPSLYVNDNFLYCYMIICVCSIFTVGILIDFMRKSILNYLYSKIEKCFGGKL